ncbi:MAG: methyltransferase domain-containing protein [Egibacteraceae bacterium]
MRGLARGLMGCLEDLLDRVAVETPAGRAVAVGWEDSAIAERLHVRWGDAALVVPGDARLPFADKTVDVLVGGGSLATLQDPQAGVRELARVTRRHLVLAMPRDPAFSVAHLVSVPEARAAGVAPGRRRRWTSPDLIRLVSTVGAVADVVKPLPWTLVWARLD